MSERASSDGEAAEEASPDKSVVLVINKSADKLKELKAILEPRYKAVCVKDEASAGKYLAKHEVAYVIRGGSDT